jgi:hypothetical protein
MKTRRDEIFHSGFFVFGLSAASHMVYAVAGVPKILPS